MTTLDPRTRMLLEAPIAPTIARLAIPNVLVMVAQASAGLIETYFVGKLGTDALAGMALVFPIVMLMQMMSAGAIGGGIASSIARALGGGRRDDANAVVLHALVIALAFGAIFTVGLWFGGRWLYTQMGGSGAALDAALVYSNWIFAGAVFVWLFNSLAAVLRGTGNMAVPAKITVYGVIGLVPVSPLLIFGWGPIPVMGIAGGALALLLYYIVGTLVLVAYMRSPKSLLKLSLTAIRLRAVFFRDILRVGIVSAIGVICTNLAVAIATSLVGHFGSGAIAGYGTASRLEYVLIPLVFGLGAPLLTMVGTCIGAGKRDRALQATWIGGAMAFAITELIGIAAALFPRAWLSLYGTDPVMLETGTVYLQTVGPFYGFLGLGLAMYFASQGAGRLLWPITATIVRLVIAAGLGTLAIYLGGTLGHVFLAQSAALLVYGVGIALAISGGSMFGKIGRPRRTADAVRGVQAG
ncbi:MATE family efflux transporter [Pigmentiphaga aceris]|uniref:MATE family efflux transporter n=1 Tax=Pigmentiphaga aceris TaxID=1940612 RepID=A0A5C0B5N1_9BURK|nr:MATE family efflux transporter [Pigmentiphaga aceris]QEI07837.1 MATE family efflux transporter [Pigmentiphaga aceris]